MIFKTLSTHCSPLPYSDGKMRKRTREPEEGGTEKCQR